MIPEFNNYVLLLTKLFFIIGALIYLVFAVIVVKQTTTMSKNVHDKFNAILISFSYLHLAFSIFLILLTLIAI